MRHGRIGMWRGPSAAAAVVPKAQLPFNFRLSHKRLCSSTSYLRPRPSLQRPNSAQ